jgi:hypothetical protein
MRDEIWAQRAARSHRRPAATLLFGAALGCTLLSCASQEATATPTATTAIVAIAASSPAAIAAPSPTTAGTAEATPTLTVDERAAVAAFERYIALAMEARTKNPSREALDVTSYATGELASVFSAKLKAEIEQGTYWEGTASFVVDFVTTRDQHGIVLDGCLVSELTKYRTLDDSVLSPRHREASATRARVDFVGKWLPGAAEVLEQACDE